MKINPLIIGKSIIKVPIVQGGMGVRVSLSSLSSAVANEGGMGTISSIGLGDMEKGKYDYERLMREAFVQEIRKAKSSTDGHLAINVMGVLSNCEDLIRAAVNEGIENIVYGAGLPVKLPEVVEDRSINLIPIVSSAKVAKFILKTWDKRYGILPDALIIEGTMAGGHLGFSHEQLQNPEEYALSIILSEVLEAIKPFEDKYSQKVPLIVAGGIYDGNDIAKMLLQGASGVQMGTRFVCTHECGVSEKFKQAYLEAKEEDIIIVNSPVGLPGRVINNTFIKRIEQEGKLKIKCPYRCLTACKLTEARYCIAVALLNSYMGDLDNGLIFCGQNAHRVKEIIPVKQLMKELTDQIEAFDPGS